jgi:preprotein translocase subunit SecG
MYTTVTILIILTSILLVLVILIQNPKGGGIASGIMGSNQLMGVKKTTDFIEKLTWGLALALVLFCLIASFSLPNKEERNLGTSMQEQLDNNASAPQRKTQTIPSNPQGQPQPGQQTQPANPGQPAQPAQK